MKNLTQALYTIRLFLVIIYTAADQCPALLCLRRVFQGLRFETHVLLTVRL